MVWCGMWYGMANWLCYIIRVWLPPSVQHLKMDRSFWFRVLALLCLITLAECKVYYIGTKLTPIYPERNETHHLLTLNHFVSNFSDFLANDTTLIFMPGYHTLESKLVVEHVYSFSMSGAYLPSSEAVIVCKCQAMFEFRDISMITVSGLGFLGCVQNQFISVFRFQLRVSKFYNQAEINSTILTLSDSNASLDKVAFIPAVGALLHAFRNDLCNGTTRFDLVHCTC